MKCINSATLACITIVTDTKLVTAGGYVIMDTIMLYIGWDVTNFLFWVKRRQAF